MAAIPFPDPPLAADGLRLRPKRREDRERLVAAVADPEIPRWTSIRAGYALADADAWFEESERLRRAGEHLNLLIVDERDALLGSIGLIVEDPPGGRSARIPEIGYWVAREARGRGVAPRAVGLLRDWAADTLGFERIELLIQPANDASIRVAEKAGFRDTGARRECSRGCEGRPHAVYAWERPAAPAPIR